MLGTETQYLVGGARVVWEGTTRSAIDDVDGNYRVTLPVADLIGTVGAVWDVVSAELLEVSTYYPNGARETLLTTAEVALEPVGFTGKEADEEIGLTYFGERWLIPRVGRWASADPAEIHAMSGGEVGNAYHYVGGACLQQRDPTGLGPPGSRPATQSEVARGVPSGASVEPSRDMADGSMQNRWTTEDGRTGVLITPPSTPQQRAESNAAAAENGAEIAVLQVPVLGIGITGQVIGSCVPGGGEIQDLATLTDPNASMFDKGMSGLSLGLSLPSGGTFLNWSAVRGALRGADALANAVNRADDALDAARRAVQAAPPASVVPTANPAAVVAAPSPGTATPSTGAVPTAGGGPPASGVPPPPPPGGGGAPGGSTVTIAPIVPTSRPATTNTRAIFGRELARRIDDVLLGDRPLSALSATDRARAAQFFRQIAPHTAPNALRNLQMQFNIARAQYLEGVRQLAPGNFTEFSAAMQRLAEP